MAKKKVAKKISKKKVAGKVSKKTSNKTSKKKVNKNGFSFSERVLKRKIRKATKLLLYSLVIFIISFILYGITSISPLEEMFGFIVIFSGAIVILGIISEFIFFFLKRSGK